jgi:hypothetical protein
MESIDSSLLSCGYEPLKIIGKGKLSHDNHKLKTLLKILAGSIGRAVLCRRVSNGARVVIKQVFLSHNYHRFRVSNADILLR